MVEGFQSLWGGAEGFLNFGGEVSLEGSSSSDSREESSSEDNDGIIVCIGLGCILKALSNSLHISVASCLQVWKSLRIREGGGFPRPGATRICSSESSNLKGCVPIRRVRPWNLLKNLGSWSTARDAGHWLIMCFSSPSVGLAAGRHSRHSLSCQCAWSAGPRW